METIKQGIGPSHPSYNTHNNTVDDYTQILVKNRDGELLAQFYGPLAKIYAAKFQSAIGNK